jgi:hypothetical protein
MRRASERNYLMKGGKREGAGRPSGTKKGRTKIGISISETNAARLAEHRETGGSISGLIDRLLDIFFNRG